MANTFLATAAAGFSWTAVAAQRWREAKAPPYGLDYAIGLSSKFSASPTDTYIEHARRLHERSGICGASVAIILACWRWAA